MRKCLRVARELDLSSHIPPLLLICHGRGQRTFFKPQFPHVWNGNTNLCEGCVSIKGDELPAVQLKAAVVTDSQFPHGAPDTTLVVRSPPSLCYPETILLRAQGLSEWKKPRFLPVWDQWERGQRQSHKHSSLQVAHLSIGGNLSLCLGELKAAMQRCSLGSCSSTLPAQEMWSRRWDSGVGQAPHRHRQRYRKPNFCRLGKECPTQSSQSSPVLTIHRCAIMQKKTMKNFYLEVASVWHWKPLSKPFLGEWEVRSNPGAPRKFLSMVDGLTPLLSGEHLARTRTWHKHAHGTGQAIAVWWAGVWWVRQKRGRAAGDMVKVVLWNINLCLVPSNSEILTEVQGSLDGGWRQGNPPVKDSEPVGVTRT